MNGKADVSRIAAIETVVFLYRNRFTFARRPLRFPGDGFSSLDSTMALDATLLSSIFGMAWHGVEVSDMPTLSRRDKTGPAWKSREFT
jgi:hypothetical protein